MVDSPKECDVTISVPYIVYEGEQARLERHTKRLVIALIITILLLFASNALWLHAWMQYDYVGEETFMKEVLVDAKQGVANYVGNNGDIVNGEHKSNDSRSQAEGEKEKVGER